MCRVLARGVILLLIIGATNAKPQYGGSGGAAVNQQTGTNTVWWQDNNIMSQLQESCQSLPNFDCVRYEKCQDGFIDTSGAGQFDVRLGGDVPSNVLYPRCPIRGQVCCQVPPEPDYYDYDYGSSECGIHQECVTTYQCDGSGNIVTTGAGLLDVRAKPGSLTPCTNPEFPTVPAVCCNKPVDEVYSECPGGTVCENTYECDSGDSYGPHIDTSYINSQCHLPGDNLGICCPPKFQLHQTCPGGTFCEDALQCDEGYPYDVRNVDKSFFNQKCAWGSAGGVGVCCAKKETVHTTCPGGTVCQDLSQCATGYDYDTSISSNLFNSACYWGDSGARGVCCAPKITVHDICPGHMVCTDINQCAAGYPFASHIDISQQNELCHYDKSTGARGVCCAPKIDHDDVCPGNTVCSADLSCAADWQYPPGVDSSVFGQTCWADKTAKISGICCAPKPLPYGNQCNPSNSYCTSQASCGSGGNVRYTDNSAFCYTDAANTQVGVCCPLQHYDLCPGNSHCSFEGLCKTKVLDAYNNYIPYKSNTLWSTCQIQAGDGITGICCEGSGEGSPLIDTNILDPVTNQCGVQSSEYIKSNTQTSQVYTRVQNYGNNIQQNEAQFGEFPWQAIVFYANYTYKCGAALISNQHVITGAHCVYDLQYSPHDIKIRLGEWKVSGFDEPRPYVDRNVIYIDIHRNFKPDSLFNNVAVVTLDTPVKYEYHINSLCLPPPGYQIPAGTRCFVAGWGKDSFNGTYQHIMKKVDLPVVPNRQCQALLRQTRLGKYFRLHPSFMCAGGEKGRDACIGDGGGALACPNPKTGGYFIAGIVSWGIGCGKENVPAVYANVGKLLEFVNSSINNSPSQIHATTSKPINSGGNPY